MKWETVVSWLFFAVLTVGLVGASAAATRYTSPNYTIDASVGNSFGGDTTSANYRMTSSGGESIIGRGSGGSYLLGQGYVAQLEQAIEVTVDVSTLDLGTITPGVSETGDVVVSVRTDAPAYTVAISQDHDLTKASDTIDAVPASIATPATWNEGTTKGLGFTLSSATATALDAKWNSGAAYAGLPMSATEVYSRDGFTGGSTDTLTIQYRLDVVPTQPAGDYQNQVTYTGVVQP